ncbi:uncharacterized protein L201_003255 [Kwoniella dendrophila CBS 6074]|uniref:Amidohydrolase-related domain-containing protein n=1 Tax=Kwoniella dendrophila CBS 6074 TaxID=1295534 RepID=A0AAX4JSI2_9TREE
MSQLYIGTFVDTPFVGELRIRVNHLMEVSKEGYITHIDSLNSESSQLLLLNSTDTSNLPMEIGNHSFFLPSFIDLHIHSAQYLFNGTGLNLPLLEWLSKYAYKSESTIDSNPELAEKVYEKLVDRLLRNGTGCISAFGTIGVEANLILARKMQEAGLRGFVGKVSMDQSPSSTYGESSVSTSISTLTQFLDSLEEYLSTFESHERLIQPIITPRFVPVCSEKLLIELKKLSDKRNIRIQSHMCEGRDQIDMVWKKTGKKDHEYWDESGFLGPKTLQAHVTYLEDEMIPLIKEKQVTIAHCPLSNAYLSERQFPLREAIDNSLSVGLGTDIAGGYSPSIQTQMRQAVIISRMREGTRCESMKCSFSQSMQKEHHDLSGSKGLGSSLSVNWIESLYLATRGGKKGMGLGGFFDIGTEFDAQLIELASKDTSTGTGPLDLFSLPPIENQLDEHSWEDYIEVWWCNGDDRNRKGMWTQGRRVL